MPSKYKAGQRKEIDGMIFTFHSMAYSEQSRESKKEFAKKKGYLVRTLPEETGWSFWTRKL